MASGILGRWCNLTAGRPWPRGVAGYNLSMSEAASGDYEKINDTPVTGGNLIIPDRELGKTYYFKLSAVGTNGKEGRQGQVMLRKASPAQEQPSRSLQPLKEPHAQAPIRPPQGQRPHR